MEGHCAALEEKSKDAAREARLSHLTSTWSSEDRAALDKARAALGKFIAARASYERDLSGSDRSSVMTDEEASQRQRFLDLLQACEAGELPSYDADQLASADAMLNLNYHEALKRERIDSTVTAAGIKITERAWIPYREAWVQLGGARYPAVSGAAWRTLLSLQRSNELEAL